MGFKVKLLGGGAFREVYSILNAPLVVKTCEAGDESNQAWSKRHTTAELKRIARLSEFPWLRRYLPKVYYHDKKSGVLVMRKYYNGGDSNDREDEILHMASKAITQATGVNLRDLHNGNVMIQPPYIKIIDLGY